MKIALDYDETYTAAPMLFRPFVAQALQHGHSVTFVTFRCAEFGNEDIEADAEDLGIPIVYTEAKQKSHVFKADIWIDDHPELIPSHDELANCYLSCVKSGDMQILT